MAEKVWIANKHWNTLSHRALNSFEKRNPGVPQFTTTTEAA